MEKPLISIIVPIYNTKKYLSDCIESILRQSYTNLEIILVDDGSTDGCDKIIDEYAKKDSRITAIHQKNSGQSHARNEGIRKAHGKYISFIDADDSIKKDFISKLFSQINKGYALAVVGEQYHWIKTGRSKDTHMKKIRGQRKNESLENYVIFTMVIDGRMYAVRNKLYIAEIIRDNNLEFDERRKFAEDTKFVLDYLKKIKGKISFVLEPLYIYNYGTENSTVKKTGTDWKNWLKSYDDVKNFAGKNPSLNTRFWMKMLLLRWRISYFRSLKRASN